MRLKLTLLLLLLNIALFGFLYYLDKSRSASAGYADADRLVLDPSFTRQVDTIRLSSSLIENDWVFSRKTSENWLIESPVGWKANRYAVEKLLNQLQFLRWDTRFSLEEMRRVQQGLETYGLAPANAQLVLESGSQSITLSIGAATEIGNRLYILDPDGEHILVVHRELLTSITQNLEDFLDYQLTDIPPFEASALQIQARSQGNLRTRISKENGHWVYDSPITASADRDAVQNSLDQIYQWMAGEFYLREPENTGLERPFLRLTIEGMNRRETILVGNLTDPSEPTSPRYAKRERFPAVFSIQTGMLDSLEKAQETLRERRFLRPLSGEWTSIEIRMSSRNLTLQRLENGQWQVLFTNEAGVLQTMAADRTVVEGLIERLRQIEATRFATDAPSELDLERFGLNDPQRALRIQTSAGEVLRLRVGTLAAEEPQIYVDTDRSSTVYLVRPLILSDLSMDPLYYRDRLLRSLPDSATIENVRWSERSDPDNPLRSFSAEETPEALRNFLVQTRVERYLNLPFSDPLRLDRTRRIPWQFALEMDFRSGSSSETSSIRFLMTERLGGNRQFAVLSGEQTVFNLPENVIAVLESWTKRPLPPEPEPQDIPQPPPPLEPEEPQPLPEPEPAPESEAATVPDPAIATTPEPEPESSPKPKSEPEPESEPTPADEPIGSPESEIQRED